MKPRYDITFIGHVCYDEITSPAGETTVRPGSAVLCGAMVSARVHARTAVITKMNPRDDGIVAPLRDLGADLYVIPTEITTFSPTATSPAAPAGGIRRSARIWRGARRTLRPRRCALPRRWPRSRWKPLARLRERSQMWKKGCKPTGHHCERPGTGQSGQEADER